MSKTNQVCICCEARDNCPHYDTRRTVCVPVKCTDWEDFSTIQDTTNWQHYRIQAAIAAMQGLVSNEIHLHHADKVAEEKDINTSTFLAKCAIDIADALIEELKKGGEQ